MFGYSHQAEGPWIGIDQTKYYPTHHQALEAGRENFYHRGQEAAEKKPVWVAEIETVTPAEFVVENLTLFLGEIKEKAQVEFGQGGEDFSGWLDQYQPYDVGDKQNFSSLLYSNMYSTFEIQAGNFPVHVMTRVKTTNGILRQVSVSHSRELTDWPF